MRIRVCVSVYSSTEMILIYWHIKALKVCHSSCVILARSQITSQYHVRNNSLRSGGGLTLHYILSFCFVLITNWTVIYSSHSGLTAFLGTLQVDVKCKWSCSPWGVTFPMLSTAGIKGTSLLILINDVCWCCFLMTVRSSVIKGKLVSYLLQTESVFHCRSSFNCSCTQTQREPRIRQHITENNNKKV